MAIIFNGVQVAGDAAPSGTQTFTSSGSWTCPAGVGTVMFMICGGGGGGGNSTGAYTSIAGYGGGGGGASAYTFVSTVTAGTTYTITVGAGGVATSAGGNSSAFGVTALGASKGENGTSSGKAPIHGAGGKASLFPPSLNNGAGLGIGGGGTFMSYSAGGTPIYGANNATNGTGVGAGGGGAASSQNGTRYGGSGYRGQVTIWW